jgi:ribose transport system ATP-binding protein
VCPELRQKLEGTAVPGLVCRRLSKTYGAHKVLSDVSFEIGVGKVLAVLGGNGAGKSTLVKILAGAIAPDPGGEMSIAGSSPVGRLTTHEATELGVRVVHQEAPLVPGLALVDSVALRWRYNARLLGRIRWTAARRDVQALLDAWDVPARADDIAATLSPSGRALVSLGMAVSETGDPATVLILDELTASLPRHDIRHVREAVARVASTGCALLMVTHRLEEVAMMADNVVVLRDGSVVDQAPVGERSLAELARAIVGDAHVASHDQKQEHRPTSTVGVAGGDPADRRVGQVRRRRAAAVGPPGLEAVDISAAGGVPFSVHVRPGEVVGVTGEPGSGVEAAGRLLSGSERHCGSLRVNGVGLRGGRVADAIRVGLCYVPGDRWQYGGIRSLSVMDNIMMPRYGQYWHRRNSEARAVDALIEMLDVRPRKPSLRLGVLSGGNQQKVIFGKWVGMRPTVLIAESPTVGVDVAARQRIYALLRELAQAGTAVCVVSEDVMDIAAICDRVCVLSLRHGMRDVPCAGASWEELAANLYPSDAYERPEVTKTDTAP